MIHVLIEKQGLIQNIQRQFVAEIQNMNTAMFWVFSVHIKVIWQQELF